MVLNSLVQFERSDVEQTLWWEILSRHILRKLGGQVGDSLLAAM